MNRTITLIIVLLTISLNAWSFDFIEKGIAYNILKDGTLSVSNPYSDSDNKIEYKGDIVIPSSVSHNGKTYKVTEIGKFAFNQCKELKSVKIPEGIKRILFNAFAYLKIKSIEIPASVEKLVPGFVYICTDVNRVTVSPKNKYYTSQGNCIYNKQMTQLIFVSPSLRTYKFPASVTSVVDYAFNVSNIKRVVIPNSLTHIGGKSFSQSYIGEVYCKKELKRLPGSEKYMKDCELPEWAYGNLIYKSDK